MNRGIKTAATIAASAVTGATVGAAAIGKIASKKVNKNQSTSDKFQANFMMMNQWVKVKQEGKNLAQYFEKNGYKKIAIYGMSYVGETLLDELKGTGITVSFGIDQNADGIYSEVELVHPEDDFEKVDVIVVTPITFFDSIEEKLSTKVECPIISLEDVLYDI